jgi:hypothetical protein
MQLPSAKDLAEERDHTMQLINFFLRTSGRNVYAGKFFVCHVLNFTNLIGQTLITNSFLSGVFLNYGLSFLGSQTLSDSSNDNGPEFKTDFTFPKVAMCSISKKLLSQHGLNENLQDQHGLCMLTLNATNEKIYAILWFWYAFLAAITLVSLIYHVLLLCMPVRR